MRQQAIIFRQSESFLKASVRIEIISILFKFNFKILTLILCLLSISGIAQTQRKKVILISIDGFRPDFYLDRSWPAPNLQRLAEEGLKATGVQSVFPSLTYPSHTTITTGALPLHHGIYFNDLFEGKAGQGIWNDSLIKTPTIWSALRKAKLKSGSVMWPVTLSAPIDYNFPIHRSDEDTNVDQLTMTRPYITPRDLFDQYEQINGKINPKDFNNNKAAQDSTVEKMAMYIFKTYQPSLTALHFLSMDHAQHEFGRDSKEVQASLKVVDGLIGLLLRQVKEMGLEESTTIIITGDHGFVNTTANFSPNTLLAKMGLINGKDWKAKFNGAGGSAFLYVKNNDALVLKQVTDMLNALPVAERGLFRILNKAEMDSAGANADAMLALALNKGVRATNKIAGPLTQVVNKGGNHGNFPDIEEIKTGFIAVGPTLQKHKSIQFMRLTDIAPLIATLLDVPFKAPDGKLIEEMIR
jgi:predicted AlkP superfamily pyrophosphatase or phosphodiesterase